MALAQLDAYLERLGLDHGTLVLFDRRSSALPLADRITIEKITSPSRRRVILLRA